MEANRSRVRWTYAEFARLPTSGSTRYEIIADELVVTPAPGRRHQRVAMDLGTILNTFAHTHDLGEVYPAPFDVLFGEGDYLEPDLVWIVDPDARAIDVWRFAEGAQAPVIVGEGERLPWCPVAGGEALEIDVSEVLPAE